MLDFDRCAAGQLQLVSDVIEAVVSLSDIDPHDTMLVGATGRDILHSASGRHYPLRSTTDVDVAIALPYWGQFEELIRRLESVGDTGIRYLIRSIPVDLIPFGDVEDPAGTVRPLRRTEDMSVFGFREVFENALDLSLAGNLKIRIPSPAGYCALKMSAWVNRSASGDLRDGPDIATVVHWYAGSDVVNSYLYDTEDGVSILTSTDLDVTLASALVLGRDIAAAIGPQRVVELQSRWSDSALVRLPRVFGDEALPGWPTDSVRRQAIIKALESGIWSSG